MGKNGEGKNPLAAAQKKEEAAFFFLLKSIEKFQE